MTTVLVTDITWESLDREREVLDAIGAELRLAPATDESTLAALAADTDAILTCFARVTPAVIAAARRLRVIGRYGIGVDNIAVDAATAARIPVTNVPDYCVDEVAEHTLALLLDVVRGVSRYDRDVRAGQWRLGAGLPLRRLRGRTLGLVGFGSIARAVAARAAAFGLDVIATSRSPHPEAFAAAGATRVSLDELAARADIVSLHVPATPATHHLVDAAFLARMRPGSVLINTARGDLVEQHALVAALDSGQLAGAGLDVFTPERPAPDHPLLHHPRVVSTPHVAFFSDESIAALATRAARNVAEALAGGRPTDTVNPQVYDTHEPLETR